jgi:hypothetical protein
MTKKQDFLRNEQRRDNKAEDHRTDAIADTAASASVEPGTDQQEPHQGKVANDHNKAGNKAPTQTNQAQRTPESRHDRQTMGAGPQNQISSRKGGGGAGRTPRGAG